MFALVPTRDAKALFGKRPLNPVGPLDDRHASREQKIVRPERFELTRSRETIGVDVGESDLRLVFTDEDERGAPHGTHVGHAQTERDTLGERGLPRAQRTRERDDVSRLQQFPQAPSQRQRLLGRSRRDVEVTSRADVRSLRA